MKIVNHAKYRLSFSIQMVDLSLKLSIHTLSPLWQNKALLMRPLNPSRMKEEQDVYDKLTTSHETKKNRVTVPSVSSQENRHLGSYRQKTCLAALINGLLRGQQL